MLTAGAMSVPADVALAQQISNKPKAHLSGARSVIIQYVEKKSQAAKERTGVEFSAEQKIKMVDAIISKMETQKTYNFIH